jgi:hypothetical protein
MSAAATMSVEHAIATSLSRSIAIFSSRPASPYVRSMGSRPAVAKAEGDEDHNEDTEEQKDAARRVPRHVVSIFFG